MDGFSEREEKIINAIGSKKVTIEWIANKIFEQPLPFDANISIYNSVTRIIKKCHHSSLMWTLSKDTVTRPMKIYRKDFKP